MSAPTDGREFYLSLFGDPAPEAQRVEPPRRGERVEFRGTVRDWLRPLIADCRAGHRSIGPDPRPDPRETYVSIYLRGAA